MGETAVSFRRSELTERWNVVTIRGILAIPDGSLRLFLIAASLGRGFRMTFDIDGGREPNFASGIKGDIEGYQITTTARDRALGFAGLTQKRWANASKSWVDAGMAHRCKKGELVLFCTPRDRCLHCGQTLPKSRETGVASPVVRDIKSRSTGTGVTPIHALTSANDAEPGELQRELTEGAKRELRSGQTEGKERRGEALGFGGSDPLHEASQIRAAAKFAIANTLIDEDDLALLRLMEANAHAS